MRIRTLLILLSAALIAPAATALTIDNFEEGDFTVLDPFNPATPTFGEQTGLSPANVAGGTRLVRVNALPFGTATAALLTTGLDDGALLSSTSEGAFAFIYDGVAGGTNNGSLGALNLDLSQFSSIDVNISTLPSGADIRLTMWDGTQSRSTGFQNIVNGVNSLAIDGGLLALDLTNIKAIQVALSDLTTTPATILDISAVPIVVPEPTTGLLLMLGLAGVAVARRR